MIIKQNKLLLIEILRFVSAISILIWHYQHFSFKSYTPINYNKKELPFNDFLAVFYEIGGAGVLIFWCISGFIFFYNYEETILLKKISIRTFFINRFSRLYPLHFITLLIVLILQIIYQNLNENYFVYENNDIYHLFLQLLFISNWGFEKGYSFNGPIWSVSIELIVYFIFYFFLRVFGKTMIINIIIILSCVFIKLFTNTTYILFDCIIFFYCGGVTFLITKYFPFKNMLSFFHSISFLVLILVVPIICWYYQVYKIKYFYFIFFLFFSCSLILFCSQNFNCNKLLSKIIQNLGNMTYGSYLLHFPFQLLVVNFFNIFNFKIPIYNNLFFLFYLFSVLFLSYISYRKIEMPIQNYLRKNLIT